MDTSFESRIASHAGGLIRITKNLWWFGGRGKDSKEEQIALVIALDGGEEIHAIVDSREHNARESAIVELLLEGGLAVVALDSKFVEFI